MNAMRVAVLLIVTCAATASAQQAGWSGRADARLFAGYFDQNTRAGERGITTSTWLMGSIQHANARRILGAHVMLSGDAPFNGECGQPRLLPQTFHCGDAAALSHPLVMHLGASAALPVGSVSLQLAGAVVGEPAFGPVPHFMRASSSYDPGEPLTHHYFNPAHSAHGVITAGVARRGITLEASAFHPASTTDPYRIELGSLSGSAVRVGIAPSAKLQLQLSAAYFPASESGSQHGHSGDMRAYSLTASGGLGGLDYTAGCAAHRTAQHTPTACLVEGVLTFGAHALFARLEAVDRLEQTMSTVIAPDGSHVHTLNNHMMRTGEVAGGYALRLPVHLGWQPALGLRAAVTTIPAYFRPRYLEHNAATATLFASLRRASNGRHAHH